MASTSSNPELRRLTTPILSEEEGAQEADLSALESARRVIITSESQLPELRDGTDPEPTNVSDSPSRTDDDNVSSVCDALALPGGALRVQFTSGKSEEERTMEESSQINSLALYGFNPFGIESGTEGGDETNSEVQIFGSGKDPVSKTR